MDQKKTEAEILRDLKEQFAAQYGDAEDVRFFFAPGRVNLIGEHTDYNGGHVFPCALTIGTYAAARRRKDDRIRLFSMNGKGDHFEEFSTKDLAQEGKSGWTMYPLGVVWAFAGRGMPLPEGFEMAIYGNIPNGSGLSSSASLEVLTGFVLRELYGLPVDLVELAKIGQYSENNYNGMQCGIMDQFASAMGKEGHAIFLDTADLSYTYAPVVLKGRKLVITNSKVKHQLTDSGYNDRRKTCEAALADLQRVVPIHALGELTPEEFEAHKDAIADEDRRRKAKHAVYENARTVQAVRELQDGNIEAFGRLMNESHVSLRDDYDVSCPEIDILAEEAWKLPGVVGARITGGGFGGCTVAIVDDDAVSSYCEKLGRVYREKTGIEADFYIVEIGSGPREIATP
ncbi:MAG: galactokinase [Lachnospiraceae bacterium]|nr:galactokinase [Lachnospiraceae bacterium]